MRRISIHKPVYSLGLALLLALATIAQGQSTRAEEQRSIRIETQRQHTAAGKGVVGLVVNGQTVLQLARGDAPAASLERRLAAAALKISEAYRDGSIELTISQAEHEAGSMLLLNGKALLAAGAAEVQLFGHDSEALAQIWRAELQRALGLPVDEPVLPAAPQTEGDATDTDSLFDEASTRFEMPKGKSGGKGKAVAVGKPKDKDKARVAAPQDADPPADAAPKAQRTTTGQVGHGGVQDVNLNALTPDPAFERLHVSVGHSVYEPPLETRFASGYPPAELVAQVTGPPSEDASRIAVEWAIRVKTGSPLSSRIALRGLKLTPDELAKLPKAEAKAIKAEAAAAGTPPRAPLPAMGVAPGKSRTVKLEYTISSIGEPMEGVAEVQIVNKALKLPRETFTWFSNAPEGVTIPQLLYFADLPVGISGRLVYHHQNQGKDNLQFFARLVNEGSEVGAVHVTPGSCAADINTYFVGYKSCENFWANLNTGAGYVLRIPPGSQALLCGQSLPRGYTSSGYYKLTNLAGCNLRIETVVLPAGHWPAETAYTRTDLASSMVYPEPYFSESREWQPGDDWLYLRLGQNAPQDLDGRTVFYGMYGVTHTYSIELSNPRAQAVTAYVVLRGSAGEVKGQFFLNDKYVVSQLVKGGEEQLLEQIVLQPGEHRRLKIIGIPLNGGFYPASIIIRETKMP